MKTKYLLAVAAFALTPPAFAADLGPTYVEPAAPIMWSWSGFYVGAQLGYAWGDFDTVATTGGVVFASGSDDANGFVGGIHIGVNWQVDNIVFGLEGDIEATGIDGHAVDAVFGVESFMDADWQGSLRARLGFAVDNWMPYITAGVAFTDVDFSSGLIGGPYDTWSDTATGWTVGLGVEYAFSPNWSARLEYRYTDFGDMGTALGPIYVGFEQDVDLDSHALRLGISYRF